MSATAGTVGRGAKHYAISDGWPQLLSGLLYEGSIADVAYPSDVPFKRDDDPDDDDDNHGLGPWDDMDDAA